MQGPGMSANVPNMSDYTLSMVVSIFMKTVGRKALEQ